MWTALPSFRQTRSPQRMLKPHAQLWSQPMTLRPMRTVLLLAWTSAWSFLIAACCVNPPTGSSYLGVNGPQRGITNAYDLAQEAGLKWANISIRWNDLEPCQGCYQWTTPICPNSSSCPITRTFCAPCSSAGSSSSCWDGTSACSSLDDQIDQAFSRTTPMGIKVVISGTPVWAQRTNLRRQDGCHNNDDPAAPPTDPSFYGNFVAAVADRYRAKIAIFELWGEPNDPDFWRGTARDYRDYILAPGYDAVATHGCGVPQTKVFAPYYALWEQSPPYDISDVSRFIRQCKDPNTGSTSDTTCRSNADCTSPEKCRLVRNIDALSFDTNRDVSTDQAMMDAVNTWMNTTGDAPGWYSVSEFGFTSDATTSTCSDCSQVISGAPGQDYVTIMNKCYGNNDCLWAFADYLTDRWRCVCPTGAVTCNLGLLDRDGTPRGKYYTIKDTFAGY